MPFACAQAPPWLLCGCSTSRNRAAQRDSEDCNTHGPGQPHQWQFAMQRRRHASPFASLTNSSAPCAAAVALRPDLHGADVHGDAAAPCPQSKGQQHRRGATPSSKSSNTAQLPYGVRKGSTTLRYVWDANGNLEALDEDAINSGDDKGGGLRRMVLSIQDRLHKAFIPNKKDVTDDYWEWLKWRLVQRLFSSTLQNLSTQSMLIAVGLGAKKAIAASAAIQWLLKDGVGRIARMTVATSFCQSFDSDLKRIRYVTSLLFDATIGFEFLTPIFPQHFLALASLANAGKAIALTAFVSVQPAFQKALCTGGNLADLTAKTQAQHMVVDMVALGISAVAMYAVRNSERGRVMMPLLAYPALAALDLWAIYWELKSVELRVFNKERAEMVAEGWLATGRVPHAREVAARERLLLPPDISDGFLPLHITSINRVITGPQEMQQLSRRYEKEQYIMAMHVPPQAQQPSEPQQQRSGQRREHRQQGCAEQRRHQEHQQQQLQQQQEQQRQACMCPSAEQQRPFAPLQRLWSRSPQPELRVTLSEDASSSDIFKAVLEAAHLRQLLRHKLLEKLGPHGNSCNSRNSRLQQQQQQQQPGGARGSADVPAPASGGSEQRAHGVRGDELWSAAGALLTPAELDGCRVLARQRAQRGLRRFVDGMQAEGWRTRTVLLSTAEKFRYLKLPAER